MRPRVPVVLSLCIYTMLAVAGWAMVFRQGFWVNDQGLKYAQVMSINATAEHDDDFRLRFVEEATGGLLPFPRVVLKKVDDHYHIFYPATYAHVVAGAERLMGSHAPMLLTLLCGIAATVALAMAARALAPGAAWIVAPLVMASPWMFYHWVFWEHTMMLAGAAAGLWLLVEGWRRDSRNLLLAAGFATALPVFLRLEGALYAGAMVAALAASHREVRRPGIFALGAAVPVLALLAMNTALWSHPLGLHYLGAQQTNEHGELGTRWETMANLLTGLRGDPLSLALAAVAGVAVVTLGTRGRIAGGVLAGAAVAHGVIRLRLHGGFEDPFLRLLERGGLLAMMPLLLVGLAEVWRRGSGDPAHAMRRALAWGAAGTIGATLVTCPHVTSIGMHAGPRIMLAATVPLIALAAVIVDEALRRRDRMFLGGAALLLAVGLADTAGHLRLVRWQTAHNAEAGRLLDAQPERFLVSDLYWFPEIHSRAQRTKDFLFLETPADAARARRFIAGRGQESYLFATHQQLPDIPQIADLRLPHRGTILDARLYRITIAEPAGETSP